MSGSSEFIPPKAPPYRTPPRLGAGIEDRTIAGQLWDIESDLGSLHRFTVDFFHAVSLFDTAEDAIRRKRQYPADRVEARDFESVLIGWKWIAARDAAMTIFHVAKTLEATRAKSGRCVFLRNTVDFPAFKRARKLFEAQFPNFDTIRHGVAHSAEITSTPKRRAENSYDGDYDSPLARIRDSTGTLLKGLHARTFTNTYDGKIVSFDVSWENWKRLDDLVVAVFRAFDNSDDAASHTG